MAKVDDFRQWRPQDGAPSTQKTVAYLGYDARNLYIIFVCFDSNPNAIRAHLTARDQVFGDDFVDVWLDTFHDHHHRSGPSNRLFSRLSCSLPVPSGRKRDLPRRLLRRRHRSTFPA
jgi:hypothetical protein